MSSKTLAGRVPFNWWQGLLLALVALVGFDIVVNFLFGVVVGVSQVTFGTNNTLVTAVETNSITLNFALFAISRAMALYFVYWLFKRSGRGWAELGLSKFPVFKFLGLISAAVVIFLLASYGIFTLLDQAAPGLNLEQEQDIVFTSAEGAGELIMSFVALVIIAPVAEEVLFRGIMFPAMMKRFGVVAAAVLTSLVFGAVHNQLNVAIITFVMSLLMIWLYLRLRSLWPAIMFHSLKNLVAFFTIFKLF